MTTSNRQKLHDEFHRDLLDEFDRDFDKTFRFVFGVWVAGVLASLAVVGSVIWAIVTLVTHLTS